MADKFKNNNILFKYDSIKQKTFFFSAFFDYIWFWFLFSWEPADTTLILWLCMSPCIITHLFVTRGCLWNFSYAAHIFHLAPATWGEKVTGACSFSLQATWSEVSQSDGIQTRNGQVAATLAQRLLHPGWWRVGATEFFISISIPCHRFCTVGENYI